MKANQSFNRINSTSYRIKLRMPNTNSKLAAAEDKHEDKERIQKLENELQNAREREKFWFKECKAVQDQLNHLQQVPVKETAEDRTEELTEQLNEAKFTIEELDKKMNKKHEEFSEFVITKKRPMEANLGNPIELGNPIVQETCEQKDVNKERIQELENKVVDLQNTIVRLENSYDVLSRKYKTKCTEIGELLRELKSSEDRLQTQLQNEKRLLFKKIKELKDELDAAQRRVCNRNCVSVTIPWICEKKLKSEIKFCGCEPQLNKLLTHHAGKIDKEDLKCEQFMQILTKCEIVDLIHEDDKNDRRTIIDETWEKLMSVNKGVCLVGIKNPSTEGGGHCIICDLDTKTTKGVMFYDLQKDEDALIMDKEKFTQYMDDPRVEGLNLHVVNLTKLEEIINKYHGDIHIRDAQIEL